MSLPDPPPPLPMGLGALFTMRRVPRRWPVALRAALCMGVPVLAGWLAHDVEAGLTATVGAFTALYGNGRPYRWRARFLGVIALALSGVVALGVATAAVPWLAVLMLVAVATTATFLGNALRVGPPGAYFFVLAAAIGLAMSAARPDPARAGALVLAGGALAWLAHLAGAPVRPRGPERSALGAAEAAVADFVAAAGTPRVDAARRRAAAALHNAWTALVNEQPPGRPGTLDGLRAQNRALHLRYAQAMRYETRPGAVAPDHPAAEEVLPRQAAAEHVRPDQAAAEDVPLGRPRLAALVRDALRPGSVHLITAVRVGAAALLAGAVAVGFGLDHAYWVVTTAVLVLHQGFDWPRTAQRGLERFAGSLAGLILAGLLLWLQPAGLALVAAIVVLQFLIELLVPRNYGLAVLFITPTALLISSGGRVADPGGLLLARGVDTAVGCTLALAVFVATARLGTATQLPDAMTAVLRAVRGVLTHLARGEVTTPAARAARRDLQHRTLVLADTWDAGTGASARQRRGAEAAWPAVVAIQRLADRTLAECWALESAGPDAARPVIEAAGAEALPAAIRDLEDAIRDRRASAATDDLPPPFGAEISTIRASSAT